MGKPILPSLWKQGLCWLLLLGPLFFLSYGQVNQYTATRHDVGTMVFNWEHSLPFIPWTIVPYWSIDLLYGISLFICTSKQELMRHGYRLLAASLIACLFFLLFPLKFSFIRPETEGLFGWLFRQLEQFDLPYNQAPSLHIMLAWLLWLRFRQHLQGGTRLVMGGWFLLIAVSVLTTWQHHFIDVLSGFIVALVIGYTIPITGRWRWQRPSPHSLRLALKYAIGAVLFLFAGWGIPHGYLLFWPALALLIVAMGYAGLGRDIFQKDGHGYLSPSAHVLLFPYLIGARLSMRWFSRNTPKTVDICAGIYLGSYPQGAVQQSAVFDLTAEFHRRAEGAWGWSGYPLLDLLVPDEPQIRQALATLNQLRQRHDTVLVCCALGLSRSALIVAAWLLTQGHFSSVQQVVDYLKKKRPQIVFSPAHLRALQPFQGGLCQTFK